MHPFDIGIPHRTNVATLLEVIGMKNGVRAQGMLRDRAALLSLSLVAIVLAVDLALPLGVASAVPYSFAVLLAAKARSRRLALNVAILCCVLTVAKMVLSPQRGSTELWKVVANRCLTVSVIAITAFLAIKRRRSEESQQQAEEQTRLHLAHLAHMARLKTAGQLAAGLAHELNQPLAAISLQSEVAARVTDAGNGPDRELLVTALNEITEQAERAASIVCTLRNLVRKSEPRRGPIAVNEMVSGTVRLIDSQARRAGLAIDVHLGRDLPPVLGDQIQLEQVLFNLLQNAIDAVVAVGAGPHVIQVTTRWDGQKSVAVCVRDTGVGLRPENVEQVFESFYTTKPEGMGLGLAISRSIVEAHGGRLWAVPNADRGATFRFTLAPAPGTPR